MRVESTNNASEAQPTRSLRSRVAPFLHDEGLIVRLDSQARVDDIAAMPRGADRHVALHERLVAHADESQRPVLALIDALRARGLVGEVRSWHSPNAILVRPTIGNRDAVMGALQIAEVDSIWSARDGMLKWRDGSMHAAESGAKLPGTNPGANVSGRGRAAAGGGEHWNLEFVRSREANAAGARGAGTRFGIIDTGVDHRHPQMRDAYAGRMADGGVVHDWAWHDFGRLPLPFPHDRHGHGTRVASVAVGRDIGVAPDATWIAVRAGRRGDITSRLDALQWMLAPTKLDGTAPRPELAPDVLGISWNAASPRETFFSDSITNLDAAGTFVVKAAGNEGLDVAGTITSPGQFEDVTTVGAIDRTGTIAPFSSHGPSPLPRPPGSRPIAKPNLTAPGVDVVMASPHLPFLRYASGSGTSYAQPHVAGAALALLGERYDLTNGAVGRLLQESAVDAGAIGHDMRYGAGILDVAAAVALLRATPRA